MKTKTKTLDDIVMDWVVGILPKFYTHERSLSQEEIRTQQENNTRTSAVGIMRRAINGAKYHDTLALNIGSFWDNTGLDWLVKMEYLHNYTGIYLPTQSGIDWFNQITDKISKEQACV